MVKALLTHHEFTGTMGTLEAQQTARAEKFAGKTLGHLVNELFGRVVVAEGTATPEQLPEDQMPTDRISLGFSFRMEMNPEWLERTRSAIKELVTLRNELVHHFIDRFDLWSEEGCAAAARYLEDCAEQIGRHLDELRLWVSCMVDAREAMAAQSKTEAFREMIVNGIAPDGSIHWPASGIAYALRQAVQTLSKQGWTRLDRARAWIEQHHPEQVPAKYGCRTWPQVLHESQLFELKYRPDDNGRKVAWFRERPVS